MLKIILISSSLLFIPMTNPMMQWTLITSLWFMISNFTMLVLYSHSYPYPLMSSTMMTDLLSTPIIILTLWISALMMMSSYKIMITNDKPLLFSNTVTMLTIVLLMCFSSYNILMFYLFFEASLLPTAALIIMWGTQPERIQATFYFLMYTITASLPLLLSISLLWSKNKTLDMLNMNFCIPVPANTLYIWWFLSCAAFMVKMPMFSTHLWLPKAHVEAPVAGSMILAAILLKLGSYGLMRFSNMFPFATLKLMPMLTAISMVGACLTGMICMRQPDMKSLIAYSSIGHMGLLLAGMSSSSSWGMNGALAMTIAHGLSSSAMFACANMMYELTHTRSMFITKGLITFSPTMSMWLFLIIAANMAAPPSINLASEIMLMTTIMSSSMMNSVFIITSSFLAGAYSFLLYTSTQHGNTTTLMLPLTPNSMRNSMTLALHIIPIVMIITNPNIMFFM